MPPLPHPRNGIRCFGHVGLGLAVPLWFCCDHHPSRLWNGWCLELRSLVALPLLPLCGTGSPPHMRARFQALLSGGGTRQSRSYVYYISYVCVCVYMYIHTYIHMYIYICTCIHAFGSRVISVTARVKLRRLSPRILRIPRTRRNHHSRPDHPHGLHLTRRVRTQLWLHRGFRVIWCIGFRGSFGFMAKS